MLRIAFVSDGEEIHGAFVLAETLGDAQKELGSPEKDEHGILSLLELQPSDVEAYNAIEALWSIGERFNLELHNIIMQAFNCGRAVERNNPSNYRLP